MYLYIYFFFLSYKLSVPTKVGDTTKVYDTYCPVYVRARRRRSPVTFGPLHASCPNEKPSQTRPLSRREDRLYQRDVLSGFARGSRYRLSIAISRLVRVPLSTRGNCLVDHEQQSSSFTPHAFPPSKKNWQGPACHSSSWFPRVVVNSLFAIMLERSRFGNRARREEESFVLLRRRRTRVFVKFYYLSRISYPPFFPSYFPIEKKKCRLISASFSFYRTFLNRILVTLLH